MDFLFTGGTAKEANSAIILSISTFKENEWNKIASEEGPPVGEVITKKDGIVYVASFPQSYPYESGSAESKLFDDMILDLLDVKQALSLK